MRSEDYQKKIQNHWVFFFLSLFSPVFCSIVGNTYTIHGDQIVCLIKKFLFSIDLSLMFWFIHDLLYWTKYITDRGLIDSYQFMT